MRTGGPRLPPSCAKRVLTMSLLLLCRRALCGRGIAVTRAFSYKVPPKDAPSTTPGSSTVTVDEDTIKHLERLSLVDFANKKGITRLEEAIKFADKLSAVETTGVEPLVSVLDDQVLYLRKDEVTEKNDVEVLMSTAVISEEDYYVAPPGNIPLVSRDLGSLKS